MLTIVQEADFVKVTDHLVCYACSMSLTQTKVHYTAPLQYMYACMNKSCDAGKGVQVRSYLQYPVTHPLTTD